MAASNAGSSPTTWRRAWGAGPREAKKMAKTAVIRRNMLGERRFLAWSATPSQECLSAHSYLLGPARFGHHSAERLLSGSRGHATCDTAARPRHGSDPVWSG